MVLFLPVRSFSLPPVPGWVLFQRVDVTPDDPPAPGITRMHTHPHPREPGTPRLYLHEPVAGKDRFDIILKLLLLRLLHQIRDDLVKRPIGPRETLRSPRMSFAIRG
mgnify:CR=1 FL=1